MTEIIFAVLFVSLMSLTRCYKTTVFLHLLFDRPNNRITNEHAATRVDICIACMCSS